MYTGLLHLHNLLRWVILLLLVYSILRALVSANTEKPFTKAQVKASLFLMISAHITLVLGLYQWFTGAIGFKVIQSLGFGEVMKDSNARFWAVEHITAMVIAIIFITLGKGVSKKNITDVAKNRQTFIFYILALLLILIATPWPGREGVGRAIFPGMN